MANEDVKNITQDTMHATIASALSAANSEDVIAIRKTVTPYQETLGTGVAPLNFPVTFIGYNSEFTAPVEEIDDYPVLDGTVNGRISVVITGSTTPVIFNRLIMQNARSGGAEWWGGSALFSNDSAIQLIKLRVLSCSSECTNSGIKWGGAIHINGDTLTFGVDIQDLYGQDCYSEDWGRGGLLQVNGGGTSRVNLTVDGIEANNCYSICPDIARWYYGAGAILIQSLVQPRLNNIKGLNCSIRSLYHAAQSDEPGWGSVLKIDDVKEYDGEPAVIINNFEASSPDILVIGADAMKGWSVLGLTNIDGVVNLRNCSLTKNNSRNGTGGLGCYVDGNWIAGNNLTVNCYDCIFRGNTGSKTNVSWPIEPWGGDNGYIETTGGADLVVNFYNCNVGTDMTAGTGEPHDWYLAGQTENITMNRVAATCIDVDSSFVDSGDSPLALTYDSPCVNAGVGGGLSTDIIGEDRPSPTGGDSDIGAYEYQWVTLPTPTFLPVAGPVEIGTEVTPQCSEAGVTFRYTDDGSDPTGASPVLSGAYTVLADVELRIIATKPGWTTSAIGSAAYVITGGSVSANRGQNIIKSLAKTRR